MHCHSQLGNGLVAGSVQEPALHLNRVAESSGDHVRTLAQQTFSQKEMVYAAFPWAAGSKDRRIVAAAFWMYPQDDLIVAIA